MTLRETTEGLVDWLKERYSGWEGISQFTGTPERLVRLYEDLCWPPAYIKSQLEAQLKVFDNGYDELLIAPGISVWVLCPHHLLPVHLKVSIGYIPNGRVLGLSKFVRIAKIMGKRPIMQEQYSMELAEYLYESLSPKGVGVSVAGTHGCMTSRGVEQEVPIITNRLIGDFLNCDATRIEFLKAVRPTWI